MASPDGSHLAVAAQVSTDELDVYSLTGGGVHTWSLTGAGVSQAGFGGGGFAGTDTLFWRADGKTLAFDWSGPGPGDKKIVTDVRLLDTSQPGGSLLADSEAIFTLHSDSGGSGFSCTDALIPSPDGTTLTCAGAQWPRSTGISMPAQGSVSVAVTYGFGEYSVATGKLITVIDPTGDPSDIAVNQQLFWTDGSSLIGTLDGPVFVLHGGTVRDIPWSSRISPAQGSVNEAAW